MWKTDNTQFSELSKLCGSRYLAVIFVAKCARKLVKYKNNWSIESRLISWVITGEMPSKGIHLNIDPELDAIYDFLCYIEDQSVKDSVIASYKASVQNRHLVYMYGLGLTESDQARVRILVRMIWYSNI